ncbi:hypothetical protein HPB51_029475 [Rhipicephalus microplus]|uniref:Uncharacterized protein n=1 Tax=Rhipicephalus microplus TaxID=6941 RepID=A0A9J6CUP8_RHIMP|nr:hypothetical protein HPB51_029475 [Rhipicephalus microplus]
MPDYGSCTAARAALGKDARATGEGGMPWVPSAHRRTRGQTHSPGSGAGLLCPLRPRGGEHATWPRMHSSTGKHVSRKERTAPLTGPSNGAEQRSPPHSNRAPSPGAARRSPLHLRLPTLCHTSRSLSTPVVRRQGAINVARGHSYPNQGVYTNRKDTLPLSSRFVNLRTPASRYLRHSAYCSRTTLSDH